MRINLLAFFKDEAAATAIEYSLIASLIAVVIVGAVTSLSTQVQGLFLSIASSL